MTCPKCGKELIIGSTLCPDCDVFEEPKKPKKKLSNRGKLIIVMLLSVLIISALVWAISYASGFKVEGEENGNGINMSYAEKIGNHFYYSDGDELCGIDERFKNSELIDKGGEIFCLNEVEGDLYYVKDNVLCRYSPEKRVKSELLKLSAEKEVSVIGNNKNSIYFLIDGSVYVFDIKTSALKGFCGGNAVISANKMYVFNDGKVERINISNGERVTICPADEFEKPIFVSGSKIFVVNYKEMKIYTVNKKNGERTEIFNSADYEKISDVSKMNYHSGQLLLTGEDGIYKVNIKSGKTTFLGETGYVNSISVVDNKIFSRRYEGASYFTNLSGKVLYKEEFDAE